jgi:uncharacterized protein (DUF342 family)
MSAEESLQTKQLLVIENTQYKFIVSVTEDNLRLFIEGEIKGSDLINKNDLINQILQKYPNVELDQSVFDEIVKIAQKSNVIKKRRIAKGHLPEQGIDGKILLLVRAYGDITSPSISESGKHSFSEINSFENVVEKQVIARIYPPKKGVDGKDVFGKIIQSKPGNPAKITLDKTAQIQSGTGNDTASTGYDRIISLVEGIVVYKSNNIKVTDELVIQEDIDNRTGNINFIGKVIINGDVNPGFSVFAKKGIVVKGAVQKATIHSTKGDIELKSFAIGDSNSAIKTGHNCYANVIHEFDVEAHENIQVKKEAVDCTLRAGKFIDLRTAHLIGGHALVVGGLECLELGNDVGKDTKISLCSIVESSIEFTKLLTNIVSHQKTIKLLELHVGPYVAESARIQQLKGEFKIRMEELFQKLKSVKESLKSLIVQRDKILKSATLDPNCRINIKKCLHAGVTFIANESKLTMHDSVKGPISVIYNEAKKEIEIVSFKEFEFSEENNGKK